MLAALHRETLPETLPLTPHSDYAIPAFDTDAMLVEVGLMLEWYLPDRGAEPTDERARRIRRDVARPAGEAGGRRRKTWVMRDFHSPNLIWLGERAGHCEVGMIDFQDAVLGPAAYDLVSLLQDARIDVPETARARAADALRQGAARRRRRLRCRPHFAALYAIMSAQRNTRLLGTFARLNRRDGKPQYLRHQPRIWTYLNRSLAHPALARLPRWYAAHVPPPFRRRFTDLLASRP